MRPGRGEWLVPAVGLCLLVVSGCAAQPQRGEVTGTVRYQGQPLGNVLVTFLPDPDRGAPGARALGRTDEQGRYRLRSEDQREGVLVGWYRVVCEDLAVNSAPRAPDGTLLRKPAVRFPPRFGDALQTTLRQQVQAGAQTLDLDLSAAH